MVARCSYRATLMVETGVHQCWDMGCVVACTVCGRHRGWYASFSLLSPEDV